MTQLNIALATTALIVLVIGLLSRPIKKSLFQEPLIAVLVGVGVGPYGLDWLSLSDWGDKTVILEQGARITLAIGLMGVALRLKQRSVGVLWRPVGILVSLAMVGMWLISSALIAWLLSLPVWTALLIGAIVTPTDPVVASSIVTGPFAQEHLPRRLRDTISFESGANDGLAYPFVMLAVLLMQNGPAEGAGRWLMEAVLRGVGGGLVIGGAIGCAAAGLLRLASQHGTVERAALLGYTVAFSLFTLSVAELAGADALLAVFLAGLIFNLRSERPDEHEERHIQEAVAKLFTLPMFVIFGIALPISEWAGHGWPLFAVAAVTPILRRAPVIAALSPALRGSLNRQDGTFLGWFGPIGIAAIYYAAFVAKEVHEPVIWPAVSAMVFSSILIHGVTAAPFTRFYAQHAGDAPRASAELE